MLIEIPYLAAKTLSARTDVETYWATQALAQSLGTNPSTIVRLAVVGLLNQARDIHPTTFEELKNAIR